MGATYTRTLILNSLVFYETIPRRIERVNEAGFSVHEETGGRRFLAIVIVPTPDTNRDRPGDPPTLRCGWE